MNIIPQSTLNKAVKSLLAICFLIDVCHSFADCDFDKDLCGYKAKGFVRHQGSSPLFPDFGSITDNTGRLGYALCDSTKLVNLGDTCELEVSIGQIQTEEGGFLSFRYNFAGKRTLTLYATLQIGISSTTKQIWTTMTPSFNGWRKVDVTLPQGLYKNIKLVVGKTDENLPCDVGIDDIRGYERADLVTTDSIPTTTDSVTTETMSTTINSIASSSATSQIVDTTNTDSVTTEIMSTNTNSIASSLATKPISDTTTIALSTASSTTTTTTTTTSTTTTTEELKTTKEEITTKDSSTQMTSLEGTTPSVILSTLTKTTDSSTESFKTTSFQNSSNYPVTSFFFKLVIVLNILKHLLY